MAVLSTQHQWVFWGHKKDWENSILDEVCLYPKPGNKWTVFKTRWRDANTLWKPCEDKGDHDDGPRRRRAVTGKKSGKFTQIRRGARPGTAHEMTSWATFLAFFFFFKVKNSNFLLLIYLIFYFYFPLWAKPCGELITFLNPLNTWNTLLSFT